MKRGALPGRKPGIVYCCDSLRAARSRPLFTCCWSSSISRAIRLLGNRSVVTFTKTSPTPIWANFRHVMRHYSRKFARFFPPGCDGASQCRICQSVCPQHSLRAYLMVGTERLELSRLAVQHPKCCASANFATSPRCAKVYHVHLTPATALQSHKTGFV